MTKNSGRPRSFDSDDALAAAMRVFRMHGYEATTMKHLERATGLLSGSIYNGFGSKKALFLAALDHYNEHVVRKRIVKHLQGAAPVEEVRALFRSVLDEPRGGQFGCLLTNTAIEFASASKPVAAKVDEGFKALADAFERHSRRARALGHSGVTRRSHRSIGLRLLHAYQGLLVLVRFGHERGALESLIDELVDDIFRGDRD